MPSQNFQTAHDYQKIEQAIHFLEGNFQEQPSLDEVARNVQLSPFHFQRLFTRWAGISPKRFIQFLTLNHAKELLAQSQSVLDSALDSGLSGPARLHDLFVTHESLTPGEFKSKGAGLTIQFGWHPSPFGECFLALTERGVCGLAFHDPKSETHPQGGSRDGILRELQWNWENARLQENPRATSALARRIFFKESDARTEPVRLLLRGTNFQVKVWEALLAIPPGAVASYQDVAAMVGRRGAERAVGNAVGANPVAYLIPCHRVLRKAGNFGNYRWGAARKKAMLAWEAAQEDRLAG